MKLDVPADHALLRLVIIASSPNQTAIMRTITMKTGMTLVIKKTTTLVHQVIASSSSNREEEEGEGDGVEQEGEVNGRNKRESSIVAAAVAVVGLMTTSSIAWMRMLMILTEVNLRELQLWRQGVLSIPPRWKVRIWWQERRN